MCVDISKRIWYTQSKEGNTMHTTFVHCLNRSFDAFEKTKKAFWGRKSKWKQNTLWQCCSQQRCCWSLCRQRRTDPQYVYIVTMDTGCQINAAACCKITRKFQWKCGQIVNKLVTRIAKQLQSLAIPLQDVPKGAIEFVVRILATNTIPMRPT